MKTNFQNFVLALVACSSVACATANETPTVEDVAPQNEIGVFDTRDYFDTSDDTSADTGVADAMPDAETCTYPATESKPCGHCGTMSRFCLPAGVWTGFTSCSGEIASAECAVGEKRTESCGNCGTQTDFCDVTTCTWTTGFCAGEGPCADGDEESTKASCTVPGEVRTRKCDSKCQWSDYSACGLPKGWLSMETAPITGRSRHAAIWTGTKMIVWGGYGTTPSYKGDGAAYDPISNKWSAIAAAPSTFSSGRRDPAAVWTGSKMIVFGGRDGSEPKNDVAIYDPALDTWEAGLVAPLSKRWGMAVAWSSTTNELYVWGGCTGTSCSSVAGDGAIYTPSTNTWRAMPTAPILPRGEVYGVWTGTEFLVYGGYKADGTDLIDGARFDPTSNSWLKFSEPASTVYSARYDNAYVWTGSTLATFGGRTTSASSSALANGAIYTPMVGWSKIADVSDTLLPPGGKRYDHVMFHNAGKLYVFSGISSASTSAVSGMASYDISTETWTNIDTTSAPTARARATAVWTGREAIIFGGGASDTATANFNNGGVYRP